MKVFEEIMGKEKLRTYQLPVKIIFSYMNFHILASILKPDSLTKKEKGNSRENKRKKIIQNTRALYRYFLYGLSGGNNAL